MTSTIQFLKNYEIFASQARYHTAQLFLSELQGVDLKSNNEKLMMLRIIEEYISSTEDLAFWLLSVSKRLQNNKHNIWELLLLEDIPNLTKKNNNDRIESTRKILNQFNRIRSAEGLLKNLGLINLNTLVNELKKKDPNANQEKISESIDYILKAIKQSISSRKAKNGLLVRAHNKIKHGMMIYLDPINSNKLWIRDLKLDKIRRKHNRNFDLNVDKNKAREIVNNIEVISHAIRGIIYLVLIDFEYRIKNGRMRNKTRNFWLDELKRLDL